MKKRPFDHRSVVGMDLAACPTSSPPDLCSSNQGRGPSPSLGIREQTPLGSLKDGRRRGLSLPS